MDDEAIVFPAFLKFGGRRCVVVGAGPVAQEKIAGLLRADGDVSVIAPRATPKIRAWARKRKIRWEAREFRPADLAGAFLTIVATSSPALHAEIFRQARRHGVLCNVVDDPEHCDFYYGSVVRRGTLQIAISTGGHSPALAQRLRKQIQRAFGPEYALWLKELGKVRKRLFAKKMPPERRRALLHRLASQASFKEFLRGRMRGSRKESAKNVSGT
jgi:precorrin-2 dehydrogenase/sirohydrochlorin ferrochelatase